jgi:hypothetical protein
VLRDQGLLRFVKPGRHAHRYPAGLYPAGRLLGNGTVRQRDALDPVPNDTPVADFKCFVCERIFQLKAKDGRFGLRITGAAYQRTVDGDLRISDIATLLKHAHKAATYKPALLKGYRRSNTSVNATDRNPAGSVKDPRFVP